MKKTEYITKMGVMLAMLCALSFMESKICAAFPYGIRIGLANVVIMLCLFSVNFKSAFTLSVLKSAFVFATRGVTAFFMSLSGGVLSILAVFLLLKIKKPSIMLCSVGGAIVHNLAQLCVCALILKSIYAFFYAPVLIIAGVIAGTLTGGCICAAQKSVKQHKDLTTNQRG